MKNRLTIFFLLCCSCLLFLLNISNAALQGDINQDNVVNLQDVILGLQVSSDSGTTIPQIVDDIDVNQDGKIGLAEAVYILQFLKSSTIISVPLNDTGLTWGGQYPDGNSTGCSGVEVNSQDCSHGRDATHNDDTDGLAGFSFTKLDSNGVALPDQSVDYEDTQWVCVKDNVTGLIWEVKTNDGEMRDLDDLYYWYNTDASTNGGSSGHDGNDLGTCYGYNANDPSSFCNTQAYENRVNATGLCGANDWRMPGRVELQSLINYDLAYPSRFIDPDFFPNQAYVGYWTGTPSSANEYQLNYAWYVSLSLGGVDISLKGHTNHIRLVRGN